MEEKFNHHISWMQEVVPRVVAIAVSTVMTKCRIFCQSSFFMVVFLIYEFFLLFIHYSLSFIIPCYSERSEESR